MKLFGLLLCALLSLACGGAERSGETVPLSVLDSVGGKGSGYADFLEPPSDVLELPSGLRYKVLKSGDGTRNPTVRDKVVVHYSGWTKDGKLFDSSLKRGQPTRLGLKGVIKGWQEGVPLMVIGEKRRFWIPAKLAYADAPKGPRGELIFDIELLDIE